MILDYEELALISQLGCTERLECIRQLELSLLNIDAQGEEKEEIRKFTLALHSKLLKATDKEYETMRKTVNMLM